MRASSGAKLYRRKDPGAHRRVRACLDGRAQELIEEDAKQACLASVFAASPRSSDTPPSARTIGFNFKMMQ
eukprot:jgi/Mesen1/7889/ME000420S07033